MVKSVSGHIQYVYLFIFVAVDIIQKTHLLVYLNTFM